jgi:hypothetical protein
MFLQHIRECLRYANDVRKRLKSRLILSAGKNCWTCSYAG